MNRNIYILINDKDKREQLVRYLTINNKYINSINFLYNSMLKIEESYTSFEQLVDYEHIYQQFANEIKTDLSILIVNETVFSDIDAFAREFLAKTYCNVYDASGLVYYCFVTNEHPHIIDEFYSYFSSLDEEILKTVYMYLDNNLNALKTARDLFLHRNTLNYRLNKFQFLIGIDIKTTQSVSLIHSYRIRRHYRFIR